jgi:hypothetical protein
MKQKPVTFYPGQHTRHALEKIGQADHNRPKAHVVELAVKAFAVLFERDKFAALKLADEFDSAHQN